MKKISIYIAGLFVAAGLAFSVAVPTAQAVNVFETCSGNADSAVCKSTGDKADSMVKVVVNVILWALGIVSVIMVIIGGFMFVTSSGDPGRAKNARNTILYAVIGLVIAVSSYAIVNFVLGRFK